MSHWGNLLGSDNGGQRVITTNANAHNHTPENDETNDVTSGRTRGQSLADCGKDNDDKFETIHLLTTDQVGQHTETKLANNSSGRGSQLDGVIRAGRHSSDARVVDYSQHGGQERGREDVVGISEETNTGDNTSADMVPAERGLVDLGEGEATTLVEIGDV